MDITDAERLSDAVVTWTGYGVTAWPRRDEARLVESLGSTVAIEVLLRVQRLEEEFYESDAWRTARTLGEAGDTAADRFRRLHPEITDAAVAALRWCYTFDYK